MDFFAVEAFACSGALDLVQKNALLIPNIKHLILGRAPRGLPVLAVLGGLRRDFMPRAWAATCSVCAGVVLVAKVLVKTRTVRSG